MDKVQTQHIHCNGFPAEFPSDRVAIVTGGRVAMRKCAARLVSP
nr:hypothetical protein [Variovorax paradoxus]